MRVVLVARRLWQALVLAALVLCITVSLILGAAHVRALEPSLPTPSGPISSWTGRLIIELDAPVPSRALSATERGVARDAVALQQERVADQLHLALPDVAIEARTRTALNALVVRVDDPPKDLFERISAIQGVSSVYDEAEFLPSLYSSVPSMGGNDAWEWVGGEDYAGAGVRVAVIDAGINDGHPMLASGDLAYPSGYPKGDTRFTTPKVIVARAYFRPEDPPVAGEDTPVPGAQGSSHGLHVASVIAGERTAANYRSLDTNLVGVAPRAQLMNYRVFYPSQSGRHVAYSSQIVQAIDDAVSDGAQVLCLPWNSVLPRPSHRAPSQPP